MYMNYSTYNTYNTYTRVVGAPTRITIRSSSGNIVNMQFTSHPSSPAAKRNQQLTHLLSDSSDQL